MWSFDQMNYIEWYIGLENCEDSTQADFTDWRMPNINELKSLLDRDLSNPPTSFPGFPSTELNFFFSSTTNSYVEGNGSAWVIDANRGESYSPGKSNYMEANIKCVRGPL